MAARFRRVAETERKQMKITVNGQSVSVLEGDTLLVALMMSVGYLRRSEFGDGNRAGFCMMGACQDCWVYTPDGVKVRACSTTVAEGMQVTTAEPEGLWSTQN